MTLVNDYFDLTMQKIDRDFILIMDRLSETDDIRVHPVKIQAQSKSQSKTSSVVMYHREYQ